MSSLDSTFKGRQEFFDNALKTYGADAKGATWNSQAAQYVRFDQLLKLHADKSVPFSLVDYGCGYGGLVNYLKERGYQFTYTGYDVVPAAIATAQNTYQAETNCTFTSDLASVQPADYVIGSGLFNNILAETPGDAWFQYMLDTVKAMWNLCQKGLAFNCLTGYSDAEHMRDNLFYADPLKVFDYCKRNLSKQVALLHDYGIYDFTILVRRETV